MRVKTKIGGHRHPFQYDLCDMGFPMRSLSLLKKAPLDDPHTEERNFQVDWLCLLNAVEVPVKPDLRAPTSRCRRA